MTNDLLDLPLFEPDHRALAAGLAQWSAGHLRQYDGTDVDGHCRDLVRQLGAAGWLAWAVGDAAYGGARAAIDTRAVCLARETLAAHSGLADFAFAMQGLGSGAIALAGNAALKQRYLPRVACGEAIAAFALSEPQAGSDVGAIALAARRAGEAYVLDGEKTWISNGGIADFYVVFARTGPDTGTRGLSAFVVDADAPGLSVAERIEVSAPHPLARLRFADCRVAASQRLGDEGEGFKLAMRTLDIFLMASEIDAAALLTYRAAWRRDQGHAVTREAAMAKLAATESAQRVIDGAVQLHGGLGVVANHPMERLYREIRALRIYEGASEVQQLIIARELLRAGG